MNESKDILGDPRSIFGVDPALAPRIVTPLIIVRLLDQDDVIASNPATGVRALPKELRWRNWSGGTPEEISSALTALSHLGKADQIGAESVATHPALTEALRRIAQVQQRVLADIVRSVSALPMKSWVERTKTLQKLDQLIYETATSHDVLRATPPALTGLMAALADPQLGESVFDPYFGRSGLLVAAWNWALRDAPSVVEPPRATLEMWGLEINPDAYLVEIARLLLSNAPTAGLILSENAASNALRKRLPGPFDVVLTNPPIGQRPNRIPRFRESPIIAPHEVGDFVEQILSYLKPTGRAVIAVHDSFLFRGGADREIRRRLVEHGNIQAVVGLPPGIFMPHTSVAGSLLLLRKESHRDHLRMADASPFFEARQGRKQPAINPLMAQQLAQMVSAPAPPSSAPVPPQVDPRGLQTGRLSRSVWNVSMEDVAAADWDLTPRRREMGGIEEALASLRDAKGEKAKIVMLEEVVEVIPGRVVPPEGLEEDAVDGSKPGYVRISDLAGGRIQGVTAWIRSSFALDDSPRLRGGDVLLSRSGTVGKVALIRDRGVGAVPSSGLYILRPKRSELDPRFLVAYLSSSVCQQWLDTRRRGAAVQTINRQTLGQLPVPVLSLRLQALAAREFETGGIDVLESVHSQSADQLTPLLTQVIQLVPVAGEGVTTAPSLQRVPDIVVSLARVRNLLSHDVAIGEELRGPLMYLLDVATRIRGVDRLPPGPSLFAVIQEAGQSFQSATSRMLLEVEKAELEDAKRQLGESLRLPGIADGEQVPLFADTLPRKGHKHLARLVVSLGERLRDWMSAVAESLLSNVRVRVASDISMLRAGSTAELTVSLVNDGVLPLRAFRVATEPQWGSMRVDLFPESGVMQFTLRGEVPPAPGPVLLNFEWSARKLDGSDVNGEMQMSLEVVTHNIHERSGTEELGENPYVTGTPLSSKSGNDVFFGREALLLRIAQQVINHGNVILLEGNRRAGKTSILRHLEGKSAIRGWLAVYASLQGAEGASQVVGVPTQAVFREFAGSIARALVTEKMETPLPDGRIIPIEGSLLGIGKACREGISDATPFSDFRGYLEVVLQTLAKERLGLLLMLDEFDKLQEGIDRGVTSPQVPDNIRFLIQTYPRCSAILTGSRRLKRLRQEYWSALYGLGISMPVTALSPEDARRVVLEPLRGRLAYSPEAVETVLVLTACQPYLLQCLCNRIFELAASTGVRSITLNEVESSAAGLVKDNEHFANLWDYAAQGSSVGKCRRHYILYLCADAFREGNDPDFGTLREMLAQHGVEVGDEALAADLEYLRELDLIAFDASQGDKRYRLAVPLMTDWIEQQQDRTVVQRRALTEAEEEGE